MVVCFFFKYRFLESAEPRCDPGSCPFGIIGSVVKQNEMKDSYKLSMIKVGTVAQR